MVESHPAPSDLTTLRAIFAQRPALHPHFLEAVLTAHGSLANAVDYLSSLPDAVIPDLAVPDAVLSAQPRVSSPLLDLSDPATAQTILDNVTAIMVPALRSRLIGLPLPDVSGEADRVSYSLTGLSLTELLLQESHVSASARPEGVDIIADAVNIDVNISSWMYRIRFPRLSDSGRAHLSLRGLRADISLRERAGTIVVDHCVCALHGDVTFRAGDSRLSWLYNSLAAVAKSAIRRTVETTLEQAIKQSLEEQMHDWTTWFTL